MVVQFRTVTDEEDRRDGRVVSVRSTQWDRTPGAYSGLMFPAVSLAIAPSKRTKQRNAHLTGQGKGCSVRRMDDMAKGLGDSRKKEAHNNASHMRCRLWNYGGAMGFIHSM